MSSTAAATPKKWAREYETIYILRTNIEAEEAARIAGRIGEVIERLNGKITKVDNWGRRKLAYTIAKQTRGIFVYVKYVGFGDVVAEVERNLRLFESVIRFMTIVLEGNVDPATVNVDPEETKFLPIEAADEEPEPDAAQRLGLVSYEQEPRRQRVEDEFVEQEDAEAFQAPEESDEN